MSAEQKAVTIESAVILAAVASVVAAGAKHGASHSFEFWLEECIVTGAKAKLRSWEYSDDTRSAKAFTTAVAQLNPTSKDFAEQYQRLASKYGIGGTRA